jgi:acyl-coenzyme A synthetase/AMP-(fatty) acid ligase
MPALPLGPIADRARTNPEDLALLDSATSRTWAQVSAELAVAATAMLEAAPEAHQRWGVLGDNSLHTLIGHSAGLMAGVGTVAVSRQLTLRELADQIDDAHMTGLITGPGGAAASMEALEQGLVKVVVLHSTAKPTTVPAGLVMWDDWISSHSALADFPVRPASPVMVYTSGTTGRARGTETRWVLAPCSTSGEYLDKLRERAQFPAGPAHRGRPAAAQRPARRRASLLARRDCCGPRQVRGRRSTASHSGARR